MAGEEVVQGGATGADGASSSSVSSGSLESRINAAVPAEQGRVSAGPALPSSWNRFGLLSRK